MTDSTLIQIAPGREAGDESWRDRLAALRAMIAGCGQVVVAYSGGVDSSLVLRVAVEVLGDRALGVIGRSDSYSARELELALEQAASFGARVEVVSTGELSDPNFRANPVERCYFCKAELYRKLAAVAARQGAVVMDGTIADDAADWRPGRRAAGEWEVRSPLAECGFTKADVRAAATHFEIASARKPASPCLASRIPYGTEITAAALRQVEAGEQILRDLGFPECRLRHHGDVARIEVPLRAMGALLDPEIRERLVSGVRALGFRFVSLDLEGFRSGSLNRGVVAGPGASGDGATGALPGSAGRSESGNQRPAAGI